MQNKMYSVYLQYGIKYSYSTTTSNQQILFIQKNMRYRGYDNMGEDSNQNYSELSAWPMSN